MQEENSDFEDRYEQTKGEADKQEMGTGDRVGSKRFV